MGSVRPSGRSPTTPGRGKRAIPPWPREARSPGWDAAMKLRPGDTRPAAESRAAPRRIAMNAVGASQSVARPARTVGAGGVPYRRLLPHESPARQPTAVIKASWPADGASPTLRRRLKPAAKVRRGVRSRSEQTRSIQSGRPDLNGQVAHRPWTRATFASTSTSTPRMSETSITVPPMARRRGRPSGYWRLRKQPVDRQTQPRGSFGGMGQSTRSWAVGYGRIPELSSRPDRKASDSKRPVWYASTTACTRSRSLSFWRM